MKERISEVRQLLKNKTEQAEHVLDVLEKESHEAADVILRQLENRLKGLINFYLK